MFCRLENYSLDSARIFIVGLCRLCAPRVREMAHVKGPVVAGGWIKTWYEHMLEIERRRLTLAVHGAQSTHEEGRRILQWLLAGPDASTADLCAATGIQKRSASGSSGIRSLRR